MAGETLSSQAIYDSKTKTLYLEDILVPFINELTGKISRKKGIFDAELKENPSIIDGKIFKNFAITNNRYDVNTDFDAICKQTFGNNYLQADWEELKKYYNDGFSMNDLVENLNLKEFNAAYLKRSGKTNYSSRRKYFVSYHNHNKPSNYLAHENINNYFLSLGSWWGSRHIMCSKK